MKINQRVLVLREAMTKIVPMLSQKRVTVTMRGMQAFVAYDADGKPIRVNIPYLPDDATDELIDAVEGFLDHEVGHILFSKGDVPQKAAAKGKEIAFYTNAIEDTFVEREMQDKFTGSAYNLANVSRFFLKEMVTPKLKVAINDDNEEAQLSQLIVPAIRAWSGQTEYERFMREDDKWARIKDFTNAVGADLIDRIRKVRSSDDSLELAEEIHARVSKGKPPEEEKPEHSGGKGKSPEGEEGDSQSSGGGSKGEEGQEDGAQESEASEGESEQEGKSGSEEQEGTEGNPQPEMNHDGVPEKISAAINDATGFDEGAAEALSERAAQDSKTSEYLIFTRDDDEIAPVEVGPSDIAAIKGMSDEVDSMLGPLQKDIERMIAARSAAVWTGGHKRGRLHSAALIRAEFGAVDLFRRKQKNLTKDVAVSLVVDCSGSMCSSDKIKTACYTAYALASMLERLNIAVEVIGFTTKAHSPSVAADLQRDPSLHQYARYEALYMPLFKSFDERMSTDVKARFSAVPRSGNICRSNVDGESVLHAYRRLATRREHRKIMLVLSDGNPAVHGRGDLDKHLKAVVKSIEATGTDVVGIGICDHSVSKFYSRHVIMKTVRDLPSVVGGELKKLLMK